METNLSIEERKKLLLKKLEEIEIKQISKSSFIFQCWNKKFVTVNTKLSKEVHGILPGEFITTSCWDDALNLCVGLADSPDFITKDQQVLYFLVEGNSGLTGFTSITDDKGTCLTSFKELKEQVKAVFI